MICRISGRIEDVSADAVVVAVNGLAYEVLIPAAAAIDLSQRRGAEITLHTLQYFEGNPAGANLTPRLVGFLTPADRAFFQRLTRVKGISIRRGLRALSVPIPQIAAAIEQGDIRLLTGLPEIGKKTATTIVSELQGDLDAFLDAAVPPAAAPTELNDAQRLAVEIMAQWGDRRADAERWVAAAVAADESLREADDIVRAAYKAKLSAAR